MSPWIATRFGTLRKARLAINRLTPWVSWQDVEVLALMWYVPELNAPKRKRKGKRS